MNENGNTDRPFSITRLSVQWFNGKSMLDGHSTVIKPSEEQFNMLALCWEMTFSSIWAMGTCLSQAV
jgi:hypothetical protein